MKPPNGMRARNLVAFTAERKRVQAVVEAVWKRDEWRCRVCHKRVTRTGTTPKQTGYVRFTTPAHPTLEMGRLLCGEHFFGRSRIRPPRFVFMS
jgi:hypothetical protein